MMISLLVDDDDNIHINLHTMYLFVALVYYTPSTLHFFEMTKTDKKDESKVKGCFAWTGNGHKEFTVIGIWIGLNTKKDNGWIERWPNG